MLNGLNLFCASLPSQIFMLDAIARICQDYTTLGTCGGLSANDMVLGQLCAGMLAAQNLLSKKILVKTTPLAVAVLLDGGLTPIGLPNWFVCLAGVHTDSCRRTCCLPVSAPLV
eukprot:273127-Amphidinium_carterae.1